MIRNAPAIILALLLTSVVPVAYGEETLTILHSSEHHGQVLPIEERMKPRVGGMPGRAAAVAAIRKDAPTALLVDSGDILIGTAMSSLFRGEPDIKAMNLMGYQAMAAGNHDFDFGLDHLRRLQELANFPILCSNIAGRNVELPCRRTAVVHAGSMTVGLIAILGHSNFPDTFNRDVVKLLELRDPVETARTLARALKDTEQADIVVAITHEDTEEDLVLLAQAPEIDVVIGGHTEGFDGLRTADSIAPVADQTQPGPILVKTHRLGRTIGRVDLDVSTGPRPGIGSRVTKAEARNLPITEATGTDPAVAALLDDYARQLDSLTGMVVGRSLMHLDGETSHVRTRETNLGNLLADLLRAEFGTEVALLNSGQIRDSIPPGPVEVKRVLRVLPFNSPTVTLSVTGQQLLQVLENSVSQLPQTHGRFLQLSGLTVRYDLSAPSGSRVREVQVDGRALDPNRRYTVATDSFMADGGDGFTMLAGATERIERQIPMRDLLLNALRTHPLKASTDGRLAFVGGAAEGSKPHDSHRSMPQPETADPGVSR